MDNLFLLLFFFSIIALIVGLIKPTIFARFLKKVRAAFSNCDQMQLLVKFLFISGSGDYSFLKSLGKE